MLHFEFYHKPPTRNRYFGAPTLRRSCFPPSDRLASPKWRGFHAIKENEPPRIVPVGRSTGRCRRIRDHPEPILAAPAPALELGENLYQSIGVTPLVNCRGTYTIITGSQTLPEVKRAMEAASHAYVHMDELMEAWASAWRT